MTCQRILNREDIEGRILEGEGEGQGQVSRGNLVKKKEI